MKQFAMKPFRARAALALSAATLLAAALPARAGTVYRPGLWQAPLSGAANWTADILAAADVERAPGTMMAEVTSNTNNPITGTTCSWGDNKTWGYTGQMFMRAGLVYHFYKFVDDNGNYVVDGPRPEYNSDLETVYVFARDDGLYVNYITVRYPKPTVLLLR